MVAACLAALARDRRRDAPLRAMAEERLLAGLREAPATAGVFSFFYWNLRCYARPMYRYKIRGEGFEFEHEESSKPLQAGTIIRPHGQGPFEYRVTRIEKEARSVFGFSPPLNVTRGIAQAERFTRPS
jgi:hypothetical protein